MRAGRPRILIAGARTGRLPATARTPARNNDPMPLINGSVSYRKFALGDDLPKDFDQKLPTSLQRHAFREIDPRKNPEMSIGWVNALNPMDTALTVEKVLRGKYVVLGLRRDKKSLSGALLKARVNEAIRAALRERRTRKISREEIAGLRDTVKTEMLSHVSAATSLYEMLWNYEDGDVYFSCQAEKTCIEFMDIFEETFGVALVDVNLVARAERFIERTGMSVEIETLDPSHFGG